MRLTSRGLKKFFDNLVLYRLTKKAAYKEEKFGFGGKKRGLKRNTAESSADFSQFSARKHSKLKVTRTFVLAKSTVL